MGFSIRKRIRSFGYAFKGVWYALRTQHNLWIQFTILAIAIVFGFILHISHTEWLVIIGVSGVVLALELVNTALESFLDSYYPEHDPKTGRIKDIAAGAVLMAAIAAAVAGLIIFLPKIFVL